MVNTRINYYHKPQISLRHSWKGGNRFFLSNVAYVSIGNGGGTAPIGSATRTRRAEDNLIDLDGAYEINTTASIFKEEGLSENYLRASVNNHFWYGLLSTAEFVMDDNWTFSGGIDLRDYVGEHLRTPYDLYCGEFLNNRTSSANATLPVLRDYRRMPVRRFKWVMLWNTITVAMSAGAEYLEWQNMIKTISLLLSMFLQQ